jgi:hypothetical protein
MIMSLLSPAMVVGAAFLDETFARALLADPTRALTRAKMQLASDDLTPFLRGAATVAELARMVWEWELSTGRAEPPLKAPALELYPLPSTRKENLHELEAVQAA